MAERWEPITIAQVFADAAFQTGAAVHLWAYSTALPERASRLSDLPDWARGASGLDQSRVLGEETPLKQENALTWLGAELLLGRYLGLAPTELRLAARGTGRKPHLDPETHAGCRLKFNLSHSGGWTLLALACDREVGVDLEKERVFREPLSFAKRFLHPLEVYYLQHIRRDDRSEALRRLWVRKEAAAKATGFGLPLGLASFSAVAADPEDWQELTLKKARVEGVCQWSLRSLPDLPGLAAAVCVEGTAADVPELMPRLLIAQ